MENFVSMITIKIFFVKTNHENRYTFIKPNKIYRAYLYSNDSYCTIDGIYGFDIRDFIVLTYPLLRILYD